MADHRGMAPAVRSKIVSLSARLRLCVLVAAGVGLSSTGARPARNAAQVKAGGELTLGPRAALFANFDGEFSGVNQLYAGKGGLRYAW